MCIFWNLFALLWGVPHTQRARLISFVIYLSLGNLLLVMCFKSAVWGMKRKELYNQHIFSCVFSVSSCHRLNIKVSFPKRVSISEDILVNQEKRMLNFLVFLASLQSKQDDLISFILYCLLCVLHWCSNYSLVRVTKYGTRLKTHIKRNIYTPQLFRWLAGIHIYCIYDVYVDFGCCYW